jgi:signal transduction histidine kinase
MGEGFLGAMKTPALVTSATPSRVAGGSTDFLAGGGEMGARMRAFDWDSTPLGSPAHWPQSLKTIVRVMLDSRYAMWMLWGRDFTFFCNDAYLPTVGIKRDWVLGARSDRVWEEIWGDIGPRVDHVLLTGEATWDEELLLFLERRGFAEETYHTFSYSPVYGDDSRIAGMLCVVTETTTQVIEARRARALRELAALSTRGVNVSTLCAAVMKVLDADRNDIPFGALYLVDERATVARRECCTRFALESTFPPQIELRSNDEAWPFDVVAQSGRAQVVEDLPARVGVAGSRGPWPEPVTRALVVPLKAPGESRPAGFFISGLSTRSAFDDRYRSFLELVGGQVAAALADAAAYEAQRRRAEALAEIDRAKTTFFSNVSHEFRTPLTLILGPVEELASDPRLGSKGRERAALIQRNALRLQKLVNSLLDFSRIEAGRMRSRYQATHLGVLTRDLAANFESAMKSAGLRFIVDCATDLEPVYVDREQWEKIVLNLLSNAFKFTLQGEVRVSVQRDSAHALLEVKDTGIGIAAEELPRVLERFHRVEGAAGRSAEGSGIGLALVQELVQLHGGTLEAESELGVGTTFRVRLPFGSAHLAPDSIVETAARERPSDLAGAFVSESLRWLPGSTRSLELAPAEVSETGPADRRFASTFGARIVLADDSADMRAHLQSLLAPFYQVEAVVNGREALDALRRAPADLLLSDVMMPALDGFELLRMLRQDPKLAATPVILLSARAGEEARVEGLDAGADDYLIKPFAARELLARVGALIELVRMRRDADEREREIAMRLEGALADGRVGTASWQARTRELRPDANFVRLFGLPPEESEVTALGAVRSRLSPSSAERLDATLGAALRGAADFEIDDLEIVHPDGRRVWCSGRGKIRRDATGRLVAVSGAVFDVTERHLAEVEREQLLSAERAARSEAEAATHIKDEFLATLSHELRTPLSVVVSWSRILQHRYGAADEQLAKGLGLIVKNGLAQSQLISDLLDMSRIASGKIVLETQPVDLNELVVEVANSQRPAAEARGLALHAEPLTQPALVMGDATRLQQVLWNLLTNAIKFTSAGGAVNVRLARVEDRFEVTVSDTGEGISADFLPQLFTRFRQAEGGASRRHGGLGLGLAIVRQLVELHGGEVTARSAGKGQGATFSFWLAAIGTTTLESLEATGTYSLPEHLEPNLLSGLAVLAVEDQPDMLEYLRRVLEEQGARVLAASSGAQALELLERGRGSDEVDVLVTDISMPGMDGYELIRNVREALKVGPAELPAVAVTAFAREEDRARALRAGFQAHIAKPYHVAHLVSLIKRLRPG